MSLFFALVTVQALLGGFDNLWHHEITERLPSKRSAAPETALHATREFLYAFLFIGLAWFEWRGVWAALIVAGLAAEVIVTLTDFVVEDRTRRLPVLERIVHTVLAINFGIALAVFVPVLMGWWNLPSAVVAVDYGAYSLLFTVFGIGVFAWSLRNALAVYRHSRPPEWVRNPIPVGASEAQRHVLITGATGFVGGHLVRRLCAYGDALIVLTRDSERALDRFGPHVRIITSLEDLAPDTRIDAVVNLAGAPILGFPWTQRRRRILVDSRVNTTRSLVALCARLDRAPRVFISASAIGFYGVRGDQRLDEQGQPQQIFQSQLCKQWEEAAVAAESVCARVVRMRFGLVLGRDGGALPNLAMPVRLGVGAILGNGKQWVSWIHVDDLTRLIDFAIDKASLRGVVNAVSPSAATHAQFQRAMAQVLHRPMWLRAPAWMVRTALGEMAQLLVDGQRVVPRRALVTGFVFRHPDLRGALEDLLTTSVGRQLKVDLHAEVRKAPRNLGSEREGLNGTR